MQKPLFFALTALLGLSCSNTDGQTWIIKTAHTELTVADAGQEWIDLDESARDMFLEGDNPVGGFVTTLSRKYLIIAEISNEQYLFSEEIAAARKARIRNSAYSRFVYSISDQMRDLVTDDEIDIYSSLMGKSVWYTIPESLSVGPVPVADVPWDIAFAFDTMMIGEEVEIDGILYHLDSLYIVPEADMRIYTADPIRMREAALAGVTGIKVNEHILEYSDATLQTFQADTAIIVEYLSNRGSMDDNAILAEWSGGTFTCLDMDYIGLISTAAVPMDTSSPEWVITNLRNHAILADICIAFQESHPDEYAALEEDADEYAMELASEMLFADNVSSSVEITEEMIIEAYNTMDSIPMVPETRTFVAVVSDSLSLSELMDAVDSGTDPTTLGYPGYTPFLAAGEEYLSRPVAAAELPQDMSALLFLMEEGNTEWKGPVPVGGAGLQAVFRLNSIIPPHQVELEQMRSTISRNLMASISEQLTMDWLCELEVKHQLEVNSGILGDLPSDPALWVDL